MKCLLKFAVDKLKLLCYTLEKSGKETTMTVYTMYMTTNTLKVRDEQQYRRACIVVPKI